jgi:hypothetical protein
VEDEIVLTPRFFASTAIACGIALALPMLSCTSTGSQSAHEKHLGRIEQGPNARVTSDGLHRTETPRGYGVLYLKAPRPHLYRYHGIVLAPVHITYKRGFKPWNDAVEDRLRDHFRATLVRQFEDHTAWELVDAPGPGVLVLIISALELDLSAIEERTHGSKSTISAQIGDAILMVDLRDSVSGEPLVRFIKKQPLPSGTYSGTDIEYQRVRRSFDRFAERAAVTVEQLHSAMEEIQAEEAASAP